MGELLRWLGEKIEYLWPLRRVRFNERGLYTVCGRWQREIGPGTWLVLPWFCEVDAEPVSSGIVQTPRIDLTLTDGSTLSAQVTAIVRIKNLRRALNNVDGYMESAQELLHSVVADRLARAAREKLAPDARTTLLASLRESTNTRADEFGLEYRGFSFTTFVFVPRAYRILSDNTTAAPW
jgi:hypothetical protein